MTTDKSKPWLHANHPEAIACKKAGQKLYTSLNKEGIRLTGVGVGVSDDNQEAVIHILLSNEEDKEKVPATFDGYQVKIILTGRIMAL